MTRARSEGSIERSPESAPGVAREAVDGIACAVPSPDALRARLDEVGYLADPGLATALFCAVRLSQPLLLEGEPGVGKTEAAKALAVALGTPLLRLQCYEGIDSAEAIYEWNYPRQLLAIRLAEAEGRPIGEADLFGRDYLVARPLLQAVEHGGPLPAVLLLDEVDRADDEFEAFLLELLAEGAVTVPELGTVRASVAPVAILTSNRTRELHEALKRRCLYHWIDFPSLERTVEIVRRRVPESATPLAETVASAVWRLRGLDLQKRPGVAEAIDWAAALDVLGFDVPDAHALRATLGSVLKDRDDMALVERQGAGWIAGGG